MALGVKEQKEVDRLALMLLLRRNDPNTEHNETAKKDAEQGEKSVSALLGKPGEFKLVPFVLTNIEGMGRVDYGTTSFIVNSASVKAEKRIAVGENLSGFSTFSD